MTKNLLLSTVALGALAVGIGCSGAPPPAQNSRKATFRDSDDAKEDDSKASDDKSADESTTTTDTSEQDKTDEDGDGVEVTEEQMQCMTTCVTKAGGPAAKYWTCSDKCEDEACSDQCWSASCAGAAEKSCDDVLGKCDDQCFPQDK